MSSPFEIAREQGYSDDEIIDFLQKNEAFSPKIQKAKEQGYSNAEITKFLSKEPSKEQRSKFEKYYERPMDIFGQSAGAGLASFPRTAYDLIKLAGTKIGFDPEKIKKREEEIPEFLKKIGRAIPTYEEAREKQQKRGAAKPENVIERGIEKAGRFAGESPYFGGIGGLRGAAGIAGAAIGAQAGEELQLNPWAQAGLTLTGAIFGHKIAGGPSAWSRQTITPEVEQYIQASREAGIDPMLTGMNPNQVQRVAQKYATHGIGGPEILQEAYESRSGQVSRAFENALNEAGENLFASKQEAGEGLREGIQEATRQVEQNKAQLYRAVDRTLPEDAMVTIGQPAVMQNHLENAIESLEETLSHSPPESSIYRRASALRRDLEGLVDHLDGDIPVRTLEATNRSLNDVIRYDRPGGADKLLIPFAREVRRELDAYGRTNRPYATARTAANEYFANDVVHIRQNLLQSIARSERPESTLAIMNNVTGVRNVERALRNLPDGQRIVDALKRYKLAELIRDKIIDPSTGLMKVGYLKNFLSRRSSDYDLLRELAGPRAIRSLGLIEHAGRGLERGFNNLVNPSKTADTLLAINSVLSPGKKITSGLGKIFKANLFEGSMETLSGLAQIIAPRFLARLTLDPAFANRVYALSRAARRNDWRAFNKILDGIDKELKKDDEEYSEYLNRR